MAWSLVWPIAGAGVDASAPLDFYTPSRRAYGGELISSCASEATCRRKSVGEADAQGDSRKFLQFCLSTEYCCPEYPRNAAPRRKSTFVGHNIATLLSLVFNKDNSVAKTHDRTKKYSSSPH